MYAVRKIRLSYLVIPVLAWAAITVPITVADAASGGRAAANVGKSVKQLRNQVSALQQQIAALQQQVNITRPPGGPAGGDLTGNYPNPLIRPGAIGAVELSGDAVTTPKIADNAVTTPKIGESAITTSKVADGSIATDDLGTESVGGRELKPVIAVIGVGVGVSAGMPKSTTVTCPDNRMLIAGGYGWTDKEASTVIASAPSETNPNGAWVVEGMVDAGSNNLYAWATCLAV